MVQVDLGARNYRYHPNRLVPKWRDDSVDAQTLLQGIVDEAGSEPTSK